VNPTSAVWRNLTLGYGSPYRILTVEGWEELPAARYDKQARASAHGAHPSAVWSEERIVTITGFCWSSTARDQLLAQLQASMTFGDGEEPLTITLAGRTLTAQAQLLAARPTLLKGEWGVGRFGWLAQWRCPDPLRYGAVHTISTPLPLAGGGLQYNLYKAGKLNYGASGITGRIVLTNPGTSAASILFGVHGALPQGYEISAAGDRLRSPVVVPSGQTIELDTAAGTVLVEGTASRRGDLTVADWMTVPKAALDGTPGELEVQFTSLGGARDASALLTATWAETYW